MGDLLRCKQNRQLASICKFNESTHKMLVNAAQAVLGKLYSVVLLATSPVVCIRIVGSIGYRGNFMRPLIKIVDHGASLRIGELHLAQQ